MGIPVGLSPEGQQLLGASLFVAGHWSARDKPNCLGRCEASAFVPSTNILPAQQLSTGEVLPLQDIWQHLEIFLVGKIQSGY